MIKMKNKAFLDTNFLINLIDPNKPFHKNANDYFEAFLVNQVELHTSTIVIAEYCVMGDIDDLPIENIKVHSFDFRTSLETGKIAKFIFKNKGSLNLGSRLIIPNDTKIITQANILNVDCFISNDTELRKIFNLLKSNNLVNFEFFNIDTSFNESFGFLPDVPVKDLGLDDFFNSLRKSKK